VFAWAGSPGIEVLGSHQAARLSILSFRIRHGALYLHHNFVVAGKEAFPGYLREARAVLSGRPAQLDDGPTGLPADFEELRWFPLPPACLPGSGAE
jgi:hypothetical protein